MPRPLKSQSHLFFSGKAVSAVLCCCLAIFLSWPFPAAHGGKGELYELDEWGVTISDVTKERQADLQLKNRSGAVIKHVKEGSIFARLSELKKNDVVTRIDSDPVADGKELAKRFGSVTCLRQS